MSDRQRAAPVSTLVLVVGFVMVGCIGLAGVLFVQGDDSFQRLGFLFALLGIGAAAFAALLKADQGVTESQHTTDVAATTLSVVNGAAHALNAATEGQARAEGMLIGAGLASTAPPPPAPGPADHSPTPPETPT